MTLIATGLFAWSAWQPQRADALTERSLALVEVRRLPEATAAADRAREIDPLSTKPIFTRATVANAAGDRRLAERLLIQAVREHPADPRVWLRLGDYQLHTQNRPGPALETLSGAVFLDPQSRAARSYFLEARARSGARRTRTKRTKRTKVGTRKRTKGTARTRKTATAGTTAATRATARTPSRFRRTHAVQQTSTFTKWPPDLASRASRVSSGQSSASARTT